MHPSGPTSNHLVANLHVSDLVGRTANAELASGVDALYLSGHGYLSEGPLGPAGGLPALRRPGLVSRSPSSSGRSPSASLRMDGASTASASTTSRAASASLRVPRLPPLRVQPRAEFLHVAGPAGTVRHFDELLRPLVDGLGFSVARIDLFCDLESMALQRRGPPGFVCRGDVCTTHEADRVCTGFSFGSRRTQRISARIYDKTAEMEAKGTDWWEAVWGERHRAECRSGGSSSRSVGPH